MRSLWLSREYKKNEKVIEKKTKNGYLLIHSETNKSILLSDKDYLRYKNNELNQDDGDWRILIGGYND